MNLTELTGHFLVFGCIMNSVAKKREGPPFTNSGQPMTTICEAILQRRIVTFSFKGERRVVHPHLVWRDKSGKLSFEGWQVDGATSSGRDLPDWIHCPITEMENLALASESFAGPHPDFNPGRYERIVCSL